MDIKKIYEAPVLEVVYYDEEELMTVSGGGGGIELPDHEWQ